MNCNLKIKNLWAFHVLFVFVATWVGIHAQNSQKFINLSVNDGLSQSTIFSIYQDSKGFMWFGTRGGGLNKYDGYDFLAYTNIPGDETSLSDNTVLSIFEDSRGVLWVGTQEGKIHKYDLNAGGFTHYDLQVGSDVLQDYTLQVRCVFEDHAGSIWVGTNQRVYKYNRESDIFEVELSDAPFPVNFTTDICEDEDGNLYLSTWDRLIRYNPEQGSYDQLTYPVDLYPGFGGLIHPLLLDSDNRLWLGSPGGLRMIDINSGFRFTNDELEKIEWPTSFNYVRVIRETTDGVIWFGTQDGLYAYNDESGTLKEFKTEPNSSESLCHNSIYSIYEDKVGALWIGTWSGLSILDKRKYNIRNYSPHYNDPNSLSDDVVSSFQEDENGFWVGTEQGGLNFLNKDRTVFTSYKHNEGDVHSLPSNNVKTVFKDSQSDLWVGTFNGGLSLYLGNGKFQNYLPGHSVYCIAEIPGKKIYIGGRRGLYVMDLETRSISDQVFDPSCGTRQIEIFVTVIFTDSRNRIWIGTRNEGLYLYDPVRAILNQFRSSKSDFTSIGGDNVISICEDAQQNILVGLYNGLNRFNEEDYSFERMNQKSAFQENIINALQTDDNGKLWITTNNGIYRYDLIKDELRHFDYLDGLQSNEFNRRACFKSSAGELFFGGVKGFNVFNPDEIKKNLDPPPVIITDLELFNKSVIPGQKDSPLSKHISETNKIVLTHRQSSFSFDFVALNYLIPEKNSYSYILEGYEDEWNKAGRERTASYMNLDPGNYTFHVKGSNNDLVWNEAGTSIDIEVRAPFWATPLAMLIYTLLMAGLLFGLIMIVRYRTQKENELMLERAEKARIKDLNVNRLQYFTNISHEFRTPLTLISGPLDKLISGKYNHQSEYLLQLMRSNVTRMLRLVNQLMDFRKIENSKMPLKVQPKNMDKFLSQIVLGFEDMANKNMIELRYVSDSKFSDGSYQWFDVGILDKVIYNLLSNAFKFTPEQGIIEVKLTSNGEMARIEVNDTGKGIEQSKVQRIFERYYSDSPDLYSSTGIGLSLSKRLIDLHRGTIEVVSEKGHGANFIVTLPIRKDSFSKDEIFTGEEEFVPRRTELDSIPSNVTLEEAYSESAKNKQLVLIAEDNPEMSSYLANHLNDYELLLAENGKLAFDLAKEKIPNLIITDIMMPEMDGIEFCKAIKKEYLTSHIPVIMLSAKAAVDEKIEGVESAGADAYLEKPFNPEYLSAVIKNLLAQRKKLKEKFSGLTSDDLVKNETVGEDELFLQKINQIVMDNISDLSFSVDQLLREVGMSRSQLYRKFKAISDKNPSEYIRILRLQHACKLLKNSSNSITEVAYMSGFYNVSYFNTCFKRHFGVSPGKYLSAEAN